VILVVFAIIAAGGSGKRFQKSGGKQFFPLKGRPVLAFTIEKFLQCGLVDYVLPVISAENFALFEAMRSKLKGNQSKLLSPVSAGNERYDSVFNGLKSLKATFKDEFEDAIILVHDGARPFVSLDLIKRVIEGTRSYGACVPAVEPADTVKRVDKSGRVLKTLKRSDLRLIQTPQGFLGKIIFKAYQKGIASGFKEITDDASFVELAGINVFVVEGDRLNFKITYPEDELIALALIEEEG
jgi:2-C-methyl-D-erythritol 4-phosphate cytidylyltransferase